MSELELRPAVAEFAQQMEKELRANDHKGGWDKCAPRHLLRRLREETIELAEVIRLKSSPERVVSEAADIANFAMMIASLFAEKKNE